MATQSLRPKLAFYWAASCGGCEISITELGMQLAVVGDLVDIVFWPCIMDFKYSDIEALKDGETHRQQHGKAPEQDGAGSRFHGPDCSLTGATLRSARFPDPGASRSAGKGIGTFLTPTHSGCP